MPFARDCVGAQVCLHEQALHGWGILCLRQYEPSDFSCELYVTTCMMTTYSLESIVKFMRFINFCGYNINLRLDVHLCSILDK